ncbi:uncharacterized protein [Typha angustifolia]|uniref:uncharacterized protein n=1 Tax=Typha angustifolia TaxID=59011 RepID=UPI003C2EDF20
MNIWSRRTYNSSARKEEDESLILFGEMLKCEKERNLSLLQPVSVDLQASQVGNYHLYKLPSGKRDFLAAGGDNNDYDWLKTPPATPLFPSLEMEANIPNMIIHKELPLPILRPPKPSRFSGKSEAIKTSRRPKSPSSKSSSSSRSITPSTRPSSSSAKTTTIKGVQVLPTELNKLALNQVKNSDMKPQVKSKILGFTDTAPPNLITAAPMHPGRPMSATRTHAEETKFESGNPRRQSRAPCVTRGRNMEFCLNGTSNLAAKGVIGSRMVEKVMNARRGVGGEEKYVRAKHATQGKEISGRLMAKSSIDITLKNVDLKKKQGSHQIGTRHVKNNSTPSSSIPSTDSSKQITLTNGIRKFLVQKKPEDKSLIRKGDNRYKC